MASVEDRLRRLGAELPAPGDDLEERLIATARTAHAERTARGRPLTSARMAGRGRLGMRLLAAALALLTAGGIAFAAVVGSGPDGWAASTGGWPLASQAAAEAVSADPLLRDAPWFAQPEGSPSLDEVDARPSLMFPVGTTYDRAIHALYVSITRSGQLPAGTALGPPLPKRIVFARSADRSALSLTAAFGYDIGSGNILLPSIAHESGMSAEDVDEARAEAARAGHVVPRGAKVVASPDPLDRCMVMVNDRLPPPCGR